MKPLVFLFLVSGHYRPGTEAVLTRIAMACLQSNKSKPNIKTPPISKQTVETKTTGFTTKVDNARRTSNDWLAVCWNTTKRKTVESWNLRQKYNRNQKRKSIQTWLQKKKKRRRKKANNNNQPTNQPTNKQTNKQTERERESERVS